MYFADSFQFKHFYVSINRFPIVLPNRISNIRKFLKTLNGITQRNISPINRLKSIQNVIAPKIIVLSLPSLSLSPSFASPF